MIKNTVIVFATAAVLAGSALPAMAGSLTATTDSDFDADYVLTQVQAKGINADSVEEWGDYIVAQVTTEDGKQAVVFLQPTTLEVVNL